MLPSAWGANFSTVEIGKAKIREFFAEQKINVTEYKGHETQELRQGFGYHQDKGQVRGSLRVALLRFTGAGVRRGYGRVC